MKNVPCSAEDGQIVRALELKGCTIHSLYRERLRVDGMLTNCQTGDRIVMCDPVDTPLPRTLLMGKYRATVIHKDQINNNTNSVCNKCLEKGHKFKECPNDWRCKKCQGTGHKQSECPEVFTDDPDTEYLNDNQHTNLDSAENDIEGDASSEGTTTEENQSDSEAEMPSQSILQLKPLPSKLRHKKKSKSPKQNKSDKTKVHIEAASKKQGQIDWYIKDQNKGSNTLNTPKSRKADKRSATTPTDELRTREGPPQRSKP